MRSNLREDLSLSSSLSLSLFLLLLLLLLLLSSSQCHAEVTVTGTRFPLSQSHRRDNDNHEAATHWLCWNATNATDCCRAIHPHSGTTTTTTAEDNCESNVAALPNHSAPTHSVWMAPAQFRQQRQTPPSAIPLWATETLTFNAATCRAESLRGKLVPGAGLHRDIQFRLPTTTTSTNTTTTVWMHLPADVFVNKEELLSSSSSHPIVAVHSAMPVDLEEPTFASPPHVVQLQIANHHATHTTNNNKKNGAQSSSQYFTVKLHLRYPTPVDDAAFCRILVPPAWIVVCNDNDDDNVHQHSSQATVITLWAAVGHPSDGTVVQLVTLGVAVVGALVMARDIWHVTRFFS